MSIEERVAQLEREVAGLKAVVLELVSAQPSIQDLTDAIKNFPKDLSDCDYGRIPGGLVKPQLLRPTNKF